MISDPKVAVVIPARWASTRFPGKPLVKIAGMTMIERVYRQASKAALVGEVLVATDDERIYECVKSFGGKVIMTGADHANGTERLAEVASTNPDLDIIVNVQGDEPVISPDTIDAAVKPLLDDASVQMSTIAAPISNVREIESSTVVKVVTDRFGNALYFSRLPIPCYRDGGIGKHLAHIGLYVYRRETLLQISSLAPTELELAECLEQLRALENGISIRVIEVKERSPAVDKPEDLEIVERAIASGKLKPAGR